MTILLGIDPGSHHTGYGLLKKQENRIELIDLGIISAKSNGSFEDRLLFIGNEIARIIANHKVNTVILEDVFTAKNIKSSLQLSHIRGVCLYEAKKAGAQVAAYATKSVKKGITGNGNALKDQVALVLGGLLSENLSVERYDATDALALAYYHATRIEIFEKFGASIDL